MSERAPKVSVIIPVYNVEKYLRECLDSVTGQTLADIEIICVDDGSTDGSPAILREYAARDGRVKVLTQENKNAGAARNNGMSVATGEYYSFLDSDDFFEPDMLEKSYIEAKNRDADIVVFRCDRYYEDTGAHERTDWTLRTGMLPARRPFAGTDVEKDVFKIFVGWPWDKLFSAEFVKKNGLSYQEQRTTNDMLFVFSAVAKADRITVLEDVFAHQRRKAGDSLSVTREKSWDCFHNALEALRDQLKAWDLFERFERDFINYSLHASLWNLGSLVWPIQEMLFDKLKGSWFRELGVTEERGADYFYNKYEYGRYCEIMDREFDEMFDRVNSEGKTLDKEGNVIPPKVSVILPSLNVGGYIRECVESVVSQSLRSLEIICVDAGSTDGTLEILREYEARDPRVQVIVSDRKSYGHQMNLGLDAATGEYIGIVETDDFASKDMFERLYGIAAREDLDFVKADFNRFVHDEDGRLLLFYNQLSEDESLYGKVLNPQEHEELFNLIMNTWSGIYKRSFLEANHIRHNETPGASFQDNGFWFQTFALAERVYFVHEPFYMNRRDNPNSSVHNKAKVYCMNEEYDFIHRFLEEDPDRKERLIYIYCYKKYNNYIMTFNRLGEEYKLEYIMRFSEEFRQHREDGELDKARFEGESWSVVTNIMDDPLSYYLTHSTYYETHPRAGIADFKKVRGYKDQIRGLRREIDGIHSSASYKIGRAVTWPVRKTRAFIQCLKEHGLSETIKIYTHRGN